VDTLKKGKIKEVFTDFEPLSINLIGHSFGGATVIKVAQDM
jgi:platelet-activating factor acetylhydrolase